MTKRSVVVSTLFGDRHTYIEDGDLIEVQPSGNLVVRAYDTQRVLLRIPAIFLSNRVTSERPCDY